MKKYLIILSCALCAQIAHADNWIASKSVDGSIIILDDRSVWKVDPYGRLDTMFWMPLDDIVVDDDALINTDEGEKVDATQIR